MSDGAAVELPRWKSHKEVWADEIVERRLSADQSQLFWALRCGALVRVSNLLAGRVPAAVDSVGGYYVRYADGFESWSPAKAFADGYVLVPPGGHVFAGQPDARQSDSVNEKVSRFRPRYRALLGSEKALHDALKAKAEELEALYDQLPNGRYKALAVTALEESVMWIVKELTK